MYKNFFSHYESEHKEIENKDNKSIASRWVKKTATAQNHFWDVRVYNYALRDILLYQVAKQAKIPSLTWSEFVVLMTPKKAA